MPSTKGEKTRMNWIFLLLGIPVGVTAGLLGKFLCKKFKPKSKTVEELLLITPLTIVFFIVILLDILL